jgi:hypothetical protein
VAARPDAAGIGASDPYNDDAEAQMQREDFSYPGVTLDEDQPFPVPAESKLEVTISITAV